MSLDSISTFWNFSNWYLSALIRLTEWVKRSRGLGHADIGILYFGNMPLLVIADMPTLNMKKYFRMLPKQNQKLFGTLNLPEHFFQCRFRVCLSRGKHYLSVVFSVDLRFIYVWQSSGKLSTEYLTPITGHLLPITSTYYSYTGQ